MTKTEISTMAERICKARDRDPADARAMLHQIAHDHGREVGLAVAAMCQTISRRRCEEVSRVFEGLPSDITFADALRIKRERGDACAQGWTRDGNVYAKLGRAL